MIPRLRRLALLAVLPLTASHAHASWPPQGLLVGESAGVQAWASLTTDNSGGALVSWVSPTGTGSTLFLEHYDRDGVVRPTWPLGGLPVCELPYQVADPRYRLPIFGAPDGTGGLFLLWTTLDVDQNTEFRLLRILGTGDIAGGWPAAGLLVKGGPVFKRDPALAADGKGGALVSWSDLEIGDMSVCVQRYAANGSIAPSWPAEGVRPSQAFTRKMQSVLCDDVAGGAWVGWIQEAYASGTSTSGVQYARYLHHVTSGGALDGAIPQDGMQISGVDYWAALGLVHDGASGVYASWRGSSFAGHNGFMVQHIASTGAVAPGWPADGIPWSDGGSGDEKGIAGDGLTGFLICGGSYDAPSSHMLLHTQRVLPDGANPQGWPSGGVLLGTLDPFDGSAYAVADGAGGSITVWPDSAADRSSIDLFARRVAANGSMTPPSGQAPTPVCVAPGMQGWFTCESDGAGGAFVLWTDQRSDDGDVYLKRVTQADLTGVPPSPPGSGRLSLGAPRPNPFTNSVVVSMVLPAGNAIAAEIVDLSGRRLRQLVPGAQELRWDGADEAGRPAGPGIYWLVAHAGGETRSVRLLRLR